MLTATIGLGNIINIALGPVAWINGCIVPGPGHAPGEEAAQGNPVVTPRQCRYVPVAQEVIYDLSGDLRHPDVFG